MGMRKDGPVTAGATMPTDASGLTVISLRRDESVWAWLAVICLALSALTEFVFDPFWASGSHSRHDMSGLPFEHVFLAFALLALGRLALGWVRGDSIDISAAGITDKSIGYRVGLVPWADIDQLIVKTGGRGWICFRVKEGSSFSGKIARRTRLHAAFSKAGLSFEYNGKNLFCTGRMRIDSRRIDAIKSLLHRHAVALKTLPEQ